MLSSPRASERLLALLIMRHQLNNGRPEVYLAMARSAVSDRQNDCRWQALIVVSDFIPHRPEAVWRVAVQHAESRSPDLRMAVTVLLLEELLVFDFETYFSRIKKRIEAGSSNLRSMLPACWGLTDEQERRVRTFLTEKAA